MNKKFSKAITIGRAVAAATIPGYIPAEIAHFGAKKLGIYTRVGKIYAGARDFVRGYEFERAGKFDKYDCAPDFLDEV